MNKNVKGIKSDGDRQDGNQGVESKRATRMKRQNLIPRLCLYKNCWRKMQKKNKSMLRV